MTQETSISSRAGRGAHACNEDHGHDKSAVRRSEGTGHETKAP